MNTYAYLVLAIAALASSQAKEDLQVCWRDTYCRDHGDIPNYCNETFELQGHRCYPQCKENYTGKKLLSCLIQVFSMVSNYCFR